MHSKNRIWFLSLTVVWLYACSPALYTPIQADAEHSGTTVESLLIGRELYAKSCGSCHNLHLPEKYTRKHWEEKMPEMQQKAKISYSEAKLITNFLVARSKAE